MHAPSSGRVRLLAALLALLALPACQKPPPHVVLVVIDTLRQDHVGAYGHAGGLTPNLDALAARGWLFENHVAHASQTVPSTLSILLSQLPAEHGFQHRSRREFVLNRPHYPEGLVLLPEVLHGAGYATAGFVANPYLAQSSGFAQGFETFAYLPEPGSALVQASIEWLRAWSTIRARPFFLYLHLMDAHQPYEPPERLARRFAPGYGPALEGNRRLFPKELDRLERTRSLYGAAVAHADVAVGTVQRALEALGVARDTIFVVTSDHGEELGEHGGIGHGTTVYGEQVRVPLVLAFPRELEAGRRVRHLTQHLDLAPTILRLAGVPSPPSFRGRDLLEPAARAFVENGAERGVYEDGWKLVWNRESEDVRLFSATDALDRTPVDDRARSEALRHALEPYLELERDRAAPAPTGAAPAWSPEEIERLRALGYAE